MLRRFCDHCLEEIKDQNFRFDGVVVEIEVISKLLQGNVQQQPRVNKKEIHLDKKCYDKKFK